MLHKNSPILLVDDSIMMRQTIKNILLAEGYSNIHTAENGKAALIRLRDTMQTGTRFRIVFLDWNMPEMDGLDFLKICRSDLKLKNLAIVMLTANSDQKSIIKALNNGATSYITKPVSAATIQKKLQDISGWFAARGPE